MFVLELGLSDIFY